MRGRIVKVVIQKVDLDTALAAFILGVSEKDEIVAVRDKAGPEDLANPNIRCIECGGSGQTRLGNFDHHNTDQELSPACRQAFEVRFLEDPDRWATRNPEKWGRMMSPLEFHLAAHLFPDWPGDYERRVAVQLEIERLVDYVSLLDTQGPEALKTHSKLPQDAFPTLSDVFSGMLLSTKDPKMQLLQGIEVCRTVLQEGLDPFGVMPELPGWKAYIEAKRQNNEAIRSAVAKARFFETEGGLKAGFVETDVFGALGALYDLGCQIAIAYSPQFGDPPIPKYTIAGNGVRIDALLSVLNEREPGWGGPAHGTIVGSPRTTGSKLRPKEVIALVLEHL